MYLSKNEILEDLLFNDFLVNEIDKSKDSLRIDIYNLKLNYEEIRKVKSINEKSDLINYISAKENFSKESQTYFFKKGRILSYIKDSTLVKIFIKDSIRYDFIFNRGSNTNLNFISKYNFINDSVIEKKYFNPKNKINYSIFEKTNKPVLEFVFEEKNYDYNGKGIIVINKSGKPLKEIYLDKNEKVDLATVLAQYDPNTEYKYRENNELFRRRSGDSRSIYEYEKGLLKTIKEGPYNQLDIFNYTDFNYYPFNSNWKIRVKVENYIYLNDSLKKCEIIVKD